MGIQLPCELSQTQWVISLLCCMVNWNKEKKQKQVYRSSVSFLIHWITPLTMERSLRSVNDSQARFLHYRFLTKLNIQTTDTGPTLSRPKYTVACSLFKLKCPFMQKNEQVLSHSMGTIVLVKNNWCWIATTSLARTLLSIGCSFILTHSTIYAHFN